MTASTGTTPGRPLLELDDVTVNFGGVKALSALTFAVDQGDVVALVGPNGAGKTTTLNAIGGLIRRNLTGRVTLDGHAIHHLTAAEVARLRIARSFQHPPLLDKETVLENVMLGANLRQGYGLLDQYVRWGKVRRAESSLLSDAYDNLRLLGIESSAQKFAGSVPYAVSKLADIARALLMRPRLLLLDEPTSGLGSGERAIVVEAISRIREAREITVVLVEHHMEMVREVADVVVGLQAGTAVKVGTPSEVLDAAEFRVALVGRRNEVVGAVPAPEQG